MNNKCPICKSTDIKLFDYPTAKNNLFKNLNILLCNTCIFRCVIDPIDPKELELYYRNEYSSEHECRTRYGKPEEYFSSEKNMFKAGRSSYQLDLAEKYFRKINDRSVLPKKILDFGAGFGTTLFLAGSKWPNAECYAIEQDESMYPYLDYINADKTTTSDCADIDVLISSQSLEHVDIFSIGGMLESMKNVLSPNGIILIDVPNNSFSSDTQYQMHVHEPHLLFFSKKSLSKLFKSYGFKILFISEYGDIISKNQINRMYNFMLKGLHRLGVLPLHPRYSIKDGKGLRMVVCKK